MSVCQGQQGIQQGGQGHWDFAGEEIEREIEAVMHGGDLPWSAQLDDQKPWHRVRIEGGRIERISPAFATIDDARGFRFPPEQPSPADH